MGRMGEAQASVLTGDAVVGDVRTGKEFYKDDPTLKLTGIIPEVVIVAGSENVPAGIHIATTLSVIDGDLVTGSIISGITIFGIAGHIDVRNVSDADAAVGEVLQGATFYAVGGAQKTGTMPTVTLAPGSDAYPEGYHAGHVGGLDAIDADFAVGNIKKDVVIFGKTGTFESTLLDDQNGWWRSDLVSYSGGAYARASVSYNGGQTIIYASKELTYHATARAVATAFLMGHADTSSSLYVQVLMDGVMQAEHGPLPTSSPEIFFAIGIKALTGTKTCSAQVKNYDGGTVILYQYNVSGTNKRMTGGISIGSVKT